MRLQISLQQCPEASRSSLRFPWRDGPPPTGALVSGIAVCLGPPSRSGMGRCPRYRQAICAREYQSFPNIGTDNLY